jgi:hypothetical protein
VSRQTCKLTKRRRRSIFQQERRGSTKAMRGGITPRLLIKDEARKKIREEEQKIREVLSKAEEEARKAPKSLPVAHKTPPHTLWRPPSSDPISKAPALAGSEMRKHTNEGQRALATHTHGGRSSSYPAHASRPVSLPPQPHHILSTVLMDYDAETAATLEQMRVFYSRFNPAKAGTVNNSKHAKV